MEASGNARKKYFCAKRMPRIPAATHKNSARLSEPVSRPPVTWASPFETPNPHSIDTDGRGASFASSGTVPIQVSQVLAVGAQVIKRYYCFCFERAGGIS